MKNLFILIQLFLFWGIGLSPGICEPGAEETPTDSIYSSYKIGNATYMISRYVIGSGGVTGAVGTNHIHWATAGETFVGGVQGANNFLFSGFWLPVGYEVIPGVDQRQAESLPKTFELHQNYPNPFNPQTTIQYDLPRVYKVTVEIFNVHGQRIRLLSSQIQGPGFVQIVWDGRNEHGEAVGSGIYLYRLTAHSANTGETKAGILFQEIKKMLLVK